MVETILYYCQPLTVIAFLVSGICCLLLQRWNFAIMNLGLSVVNFFLFYGNNIFK